METAATRAKFSGTGCCLRGNRNNGREVGRFDIRRYCREISDARPGKVGAGGGSRTHMRKNPRRIFLPSAPFAARTTGVGSLTPGLRSGLSLHPTPESWGLRCCPSSLYTFPVSGAWLGIAIAGFPEFGQFCIAGFPASTQVFLSPQRLPFRHARMAGDLQSPIIQAAKPNIHFSFPATLSTLFLWLWPHDVDRGGVEFVLKCAAFYFLIRRPP